MSLNLGISGCLSSSGVGDTVESIPSVIGLKMNMKLNFDGELFLPIWLICEHCEDWPWITFLSVIICKNQFPHVIEAIRKPYTGLVLHEWLKFKRYVPLGYAIVAIYDLVAWFTNVKDKSPKWGHNWSWWSALYDEALICAITCSFSCVGRVFIQFQKYQNMPSLYEHLRVKYIHLFGTLNMFSQNLTHMLFLYVM